DSRCTSPSGPRIVFIVSPTDRLPTWSSKWLLERPGFPVLEILQKLLSRDAVPDAFGTARSRHATRGTGGPADTVKDVLPVVLDVIEDPQVKDADVQHVCPVARGEIWLNRAGKRGRHVLSSSGCLLSFME